MFIGLQSNLRH
jgi:hypothetical protein